MIKFSIVLINFIGLFFFGVFGDVEVLIDHQTPTTMVQGKKQLVTVSVNKTEVTGFAKLELSLPFGLTATPVETNGASFTFSGQKAKFIWMTLPVEDQFNVTYNLEASKDITGNFNVTGVFSYIKENQRVDFKMEPRNVIVEPETAVAAVAKETAPAVTAAASDLPLPATVKYAELTCLRSIKKLSDTEFVVTLKMVNNNIKGFAKILETTPENCKPEKVADGGAVVTADKASIKFVWFEIPPASEVEVSYKLRCLAGLPSFPEINGKLSFVENNTPREIPVISAGNIDVEPVTTISSDSVIDPIVDPIVEPVAVVPDPIVEPEPKVKTEPVVTPKVTPEPPVVEEKKTGKAVTSVPSPETGITYKVQIMAAHRVVGKSYFNSTFGYNENFDIENHEGWVKYTTGKFPEYKTARDKRELLRGAYTLPGPFVTAYNNGERITVQEALLITKQQWYQ